MKIIGYIVTLAGLAVLSLTVKPVQEVVKLPMQINNLYLSIGGLIIILIGIIFIKKGGSSGKQVKEVPIYHGKNIVGYRRMK